MRKLIILFGILGICGSALFAQINVELQRINSLDKPIVMEQITPDKIFYIPIVEIFDENTFYFSIKNLSSQNTTYKLRKTIVSLASPDGSADLCLDVCSNDIETQSFTLAPNEKRTADMYYQQGQNMGTSTVDITLYVATNTWENTSPNDKFTFRLVFTTDPINIAVTKLQTFSIFPNPASTSFTITANFTPNTHVEVYNITGKQILKVAPKTGNSFVIDCSKWDKGYYFCRLVTDDKIIKTLKLVVTR